MKKFEISIIIPVYNIEKDLSNCLDSIKKQTFKKWKCLLIDDGSTDSSGKICDMYAKNDSRFIIKHKKNTGVSETRNLGISLADTEFIAFIDGDDWIDENYLSFLVSKMSDETDIVMCHSIVEYPNKSFELLQIRPNHIEYDKSNKLELILSSISDIYAENLTKKRHGFLNTVWGKMYRTNIIKDNNIRFDNFEINEDALFNRKVFLVSKKIRIYNKILYHYRMRDGSAVHSFKNNYLINYDNYLETVKKYIDDNFCSSKEIISSYRALTIIALFNIMKNYFYNPDFPRKSDREKEIDKLIQSNKYAVALNDFNNLYLNNKEIFFIISELKKHRYYFLKCYFKIRPVLKKIIIFFK